MNDNKPETEPPEEEDHDFEIIDKDELNHPPQTQQPPAQTKHKGLWIGVDLGTSNCAAAIWDSARGRPKWMRLPHLAAKQSNGKVGRIVPSSALLQLQQGSSHSFTACDALWQDICQWNVEASSDLQQKLSLTVGQTALDTLHQKMFQDNHKSIEVILKSVKRVLGVCYTTQLADLDPHFRNSLPFDLEETKDGEWVIPLNFSAKDTADPAVLFLKPVHVAAILLQAIRQTAQVYLQRAIPKKKLQVPGYGTVDKNDIQNVVLGVPAYFGQRQRHAVEEAARLAGFKGQVSTLTESTAAAMAYGLFVGESTKKKAILVLDMGGGTTDITIAHRTPKGSNQSQQDTSTPVDQQFQVILTDGDSRLGGEDMDQALLELVLKKANSTETTLTPQQRQRLLQSCQQAKELLCGDVDHDEPPAESATVQLPDNSRNSTSMELTRSDLDQSIQPLLDQTARLMERTLNRYVDKVQSDNLIAEVILIGGATRVPALRQMLKDKFFQHLPELCTSVNAMSAVAQGTAIQAAILSKQVPLHELRSALMLDTTPHAIGVLIGERFVEILPRDSPLPAKGYATFQVADLEQKGVTVKAVERIADDQQDSNIDHQYQPLGDFTFLLHRLSESQRRALTDGSQSLRPVDIGMSLETNGAFSVSIFDPNDPDHQRKKAFYQKSQLDENFQAGILDYVQAAAADWKSGENGITLEEWKLIAVVAVLFAFYLAVKVLLSEELEELLSEEDKARIL